MPEIAPGKTFKEAAEDIKRELDVDDDRIDFAVYKAEENKRLNDLDRQILQIGWPHIHGEYGGKWYPNEVEKAKDEYDISEDDLKRALKNMTSNDPMTDENVWVLQAVYPLEFGFHGDEFRDPNKKRGEKEDEKDKEKDKDVEEDEIIEKDKNEKPAGLRYPSGKYKNGSRLVHRYIKDERGKDFFDYLKDAVKKTGSTSSDVEIAVDRLHRGLSLSKRQKDILQAGWPHLYGKHGEPFKEKTSRYFTEKISFQVFEEFSAREKKRFQKLANEYSTLKNEIDRYKRPIKTKSSLEKKLSAVQDLIIELMRKNDISRQEHNRRRWSIRKVPTYFLITDEDKAKASIRRKRLPGLIKKIEMLDLGKIRDYVKKHPNTKIAGLKKIDDDYSLYVFELKSEGDQDNIEFFFETPYDPKNANNLQLADDIRIIYAHYSTWKKTNGKGIKFTIEDLKGFMKKAMIEVKKRIMAGEMNYTFNPQKMKEVSREFYFLVRETLPEKLKEIGEVESNSEDMKKILVECRDDDNSLELLLNEIRDRGNVGHSFTIILDPGSSEEKQIFWDGDGADYIKDIKLDDEKKN